VSSVPGPSGNESKSLCHRSTEFLVLITLILLAYEWFDSRHFQRIIDASMLLYDRCGGGGVVRDGQK